MTPKQDTAWTDIAHSHLNIFQRFAHGEICLDDYVQYLSKHVSKNSRMFPLYANDAEIFDFRPKRYATEAVCQEENEWFRIAQVFETLFYDSRFSLIPPSQVLDSLHDPEAGHRLQLESLPHHDHKHIAESIATQNPIPGAVEQGCPNPS